MFKILERTGRRNLKICIKTEMMNYPSRVQIEFGGRVGWIMLDQIWCIDKSRLMKKAGNVSEEDIFQVKGIIKEMLVD
ncbi:MAG TPA: type II toxin-antitoxin system PemK/MazF family toxin [Clostridiales bacterium]|nr:type II toxin-antitoxin system PemK/MazF family toxin [Clostridiales bacterium]